MICPYEAKPDAWPGENDMDEQTQLKDSIYPAHEKGRKLLEEAKETILKEETRQESV